MNQTSDTAAVTFHDRVAIVTGAGTGLGRSHALCLARRGVKVVVNDLGAALDGSGVASTVADSVVAEIEAFGGEAMANGANVTNPDEVDAMVADAIARWGHVDILVNNAGILRDKSFAKMPLEDFRSVVDVHLMGSVNCAKAVWPHMRERGFGRIVMTSSSSGLYGNFGQSNYGAAKTGVVGLMNVLAIEGGKSDIRVNTLSPTAMTRMTEGVFADMAGEALTPESVSAGLLVLCCDEAPSKMIMCAGAGGYSETKIYETHGTYLPPEHQTADHIMAVLPMIRSPEGQRVMPEGSGQTAHFLRMREEFREN